ncbi:SPOR domain-containing protein [Cytobacillus sp. NCCP-133]|uniref:SPOR domain-containing protein n=1 Tax=Cytobacillus sp. NCCP-133 TaxID=766848 RepID=UPI00222EA3DD|nr:SPOR domain-containing protein [Cytobacillus sp. NCCP-133]GLB58372.1 hypothetical protein NCCP133_05050 [Cytobacillus sp. NCCP-133]
MDKPNNNGKTITIKINGKDRPFQEKRDEKQEESWKVKELDRKKQKEEETEFFASIQTAAGKEADDRFDWILPEETEDSEIKEFKIASPSKKTAYQGLNSLAKTFKRKNKQGFLTSIFLAVFFAVLLGTSFGFIMLKLVFTDQSVETASPPAVSEPAVFSDQPAGMESLTLESITTYVIQEGVYKNKESAKQFQASIEKKGVPVQMYEMNGDTVLYLGVSDTLNNAKAIGNQIKNSNGLNFYAKEITFDGKSIDGLNAEEKKLLKMVPAIYQSLAAGAADASIEKSIHANVLEELKTHSENLNKLPADQIKKQGLITIKEELINASKQLDAFQQYGDSASAVKGQQHLLAFLAAYQSL